MTERRNGAPDDGAPGPGDAPEDVPPAPEDTAPESDDDVLEADISEDISAPHEEAPAERVEPSADAIAAPGRRPMRPDERRAARRPAAAPPPRPSEQAVHIEDRASRLFVLAAIAVFTLIFLNGLLLGQGGVLAPIQSPTPAPSVSASASASPAASASASPAASASPSASPSADGAGSPSPS